MDKKCGLQTEELQIGILFWLEQTQIPNVQQIKRLQGSLSIEIHLALRLVERFLKFVVELVCHIISNILSGNKHGPKSI